MFFHLYDDGDDIRFVNNANAHESVLRNVRGQTIL